MPNVIFTKYSNDREERFNIVTEIVKEKSGEQWVIKRPFTEAAKRHVRNMAENCGILKQNYQGTAVEIAETELSGDSVKIAWAKGEAFSSCLDRLLKEGAVKQWKERIEEYFKQMFPHKRSGFVGTKEFEEVFGDVWIPTGEESVSGVDVDILFSNVLYDGNKWTIYDYEWFMAFAIPVKFLIYRCLHYYISTQTHQTMPLGQVCAEFGITREQCECYRQMEDHFQKYIEGSHIPMWRLYQGIHGEVVDMRTVQERLIARHRAQVFFDKGEGFSEKDSRELLIEREEDGYYRLQLEVSPETLRVRLDPMSGACIVTVKRMTDETGNRLTYRANGYQMEENVHIFFHKDPQIIIEKTDSSAVMDIVYALQTLEGEEETALSQVKQLFSGLLREKNESMLQMKEKEREVEEGRQLLKEMEQTLSWKITKPLRLTKGKLAAWKRRLKEGGNRQEEAGEADSKAMGLEEERQNPYEAWIEEVEKDYEKINIKALDYQPKISILVPVYNVLDRHLIPCIESVIGQDYPNWELCLADDASTWPNVRKTLENYESHDRIQVVYREENGHISECTNSALKIATGEFVALLDCDDVLAPNALSEVVKLLNEDRTLDFIYSDEDKIDDDGKNRHMPHFKSDWAPDTLMSHMYTCHFGVYRRSLALEIGGERKGYEGAQDYDFVLRFTEKTDRIAHISKILYHWREREESTAATQEAKPYVVEAARKSKEDALNRRGLKANLEYIDGIHQFNANYLWDSYPKVSVIIPSKDNYEILARCLSTFRELTEYENYEFILVDNGSREENARKYEKLAETYHAKYLYEKKEFNFSHMCNLGARNAEGEYLLFLNDDIEVIESGWLLRMVGQAMVGHTGAVGAKLLYPDGKTIQHDGVILIKSGPVHVLTGCSDETIHYFGRNVLNYNQLAVTGACLLVERKKFEEVRGFDEDLAVTYNDVDLCLKLVEQGYYNLVRNDARLLHHESISRGNDVLSEKKMERLERERERLYARHPRFRDSDPFYNCNLTQSGVDFSYIFETYQDVYSKLEVTDVEIGDSENVMYAIDEISGYGVEDNLCIRGWALVVGETSPQNHPIAILLENETGTKWECTASRRERKDVDEALQGNGRYGFSGFYCKIRGMELPFGSYTIGIKMDGKGTMTDRKVEHW
ncbi:MAG: glycosyltransferase [Lachnospiraceae bacterium]|nr:glycosyltransferase [Lachnospiraceae bacterium]